MRKTLSSSGVRSTAPRRGMTCAAPVWAARTSPRCWACHHGATPTPCGARKPATPCPPSRQARSWRQATTRSWRPTSGIGTRSFPRARSCVTPEHGPTRIAAGSWPTQTASSAPETRTHPSTASWSSNTRRAAPAIGGRTAPPTSRNTTGAKCSGTWRHLASTGAMWWRCRRGDSDATGSAPTTSGRNMR